MDQVLSLAGHLIVQVGRWSYHRYLQTETCLLDLPYEINVQTNLMYTIFGTMVSKAQCLMLPIYGQYICTPYLWNLQCCMVVSKTVARVWKLEPFSGNPLLIQKSLPLPYLIPCRESPVPNQECKVQLPCEACSLVPSPTALPGKKVCRTQLYSSIERLR